jgi:RNA polymerase sigma-70 factor (ECF subfamily)
MVFERLASRGRRAHLRAIPGGASPAESPAGSEPAVPLRAHSQPVPRGTALEVDDEWLVDGIVSGDQTVAVELYRRLLPVVEATLLRVMGRRESDHEDLVQISFEQIILTLSERRYAQACSLKTWASTLAAHVALKALRSRIRQRRVFDLHVEAHEATQQYGGRDDVERSVSSKQELEVVRRELAALSPARAEAVLLHDVLGHGLAEIAVITGSSVVAAQSRLSRGRRELSERLAKVSSRGAAK